ncbi:MAG: hypothetical protein AAFZ65_01120 [Planctomycetota bacterium]
MVDLCGDPRLAIVTRGEDVVHLREVTPLAHAGDLARARQLLDTAGVSSLVACSKGLKFPWGSTALENERASDLAIVRVQDFGRWLGRALSRVYAPDGAALWAVAKRVAAAPYGAERTAVIQVDLEGALAAHYSRGRLVGLERRAGTPTAQSLLEACGPVGTEVHLCGDGVDLDRLALDLALVGGPWAQLPKPRLARPRCLAGLGGFTLAGVAEHALGGRGEEPIAWIDVGPELRVV